jgi:hypothetical protein
MIHTMNDAMEMHNNFFSDKAITPWGVGEVLA